MPRNARTVVSISTPKASLLYHAAFLLPILFAGVLLRLYQLDHEYLWYDELVSFRHLSCPSMGQFFRALLGEDPTAMPVYFLVEYYWAHTVGDSVYAVRLLSIVFGVMSICLIYRIACEYYGRLAGCVAALLIAGSFAHIRYSQEIRMYSLFVLEALLSIYVFHRMMRTPSRGWVLAHAVMSLLLLFTHILACLVLFVEVCTLALVCRNDFRLWRAWLVSSVPILLPWAWLVSGMYSRIAGSAQWIPVRSPSRIADFFLSFCIGGGVGASPMWALYIAGAILYVPVVFLAVHSWLNWRSSPHQTRDDLQVTTHLILFFLLPPVVLIVLSYLGRPLFVARYALPSTVALALLVSAGITMNRSWLWRGFFILLLIGYQGLELTRTPRPYRCFDSQMVAEHMLTEWNPKDRLYTYPFVMAAPVAYYGHLSRNQVGMSNDFDEFTKMTSSSLREGRRTWALLHDCDDKMLETLKRVAGPYASPAEEWVIPCRIRSLLLRFVPSKAIPPEDE